jgi:aminodeoxychorismate synthase component I
VPEGRDRRFSTGPGETAPAGWGSLAALADAARPCAAGRLPTGRPYVLLDDAGRDGATYLFQHPIEIISTSAAEDVASTLDRLRAAVSRGCYAAGYLSYEAGWALQQRRPATVRSGGRPLLWFGIFSDVARVSLPIKSVHGCVRTPQLSAAWAYPEYCNAVERVLTYIAAGDVYQINLTFPLTWREENDPIACYTEWRAAQRAGWGAVLSMPDRWLLSASPELFFSAEQGRLCARPMKGTARRGADATEDASLAAKLAASVKDRAENLMIVDLLRNDLAKIAEKASVQVPRLFEIETYPTILQMTSTVTATLRSGLDLIDVIRAIFPCGSITGAPKLRAMEIIDEIEPSARGPYTGSIGYLGPGGDGAFNVAIRTVNLDRVTREASMGIGSAIVSDSVNADEWNECHAKSAFITRKVC